MAGKILANGRPFAKFAKIFPLQNFPTYGIASRYSSLVEKLTRRRVIPVIATIFLLAYNKLLLVTAKVLFSYTTVYSLPDNQHLIVWIWDSSMPFLGIKFLPLFIACLLVFLFLLLPLNLFLLFTKFSYRLKFVAEYIKPYLDAYQAPFKSNCYFYFGIELLVRSIGFALGYVILDRYKIQAILIFLCIIFLLYICTVKPFRNVINTVLYASYLFNITCMILLVVYFHEKLNKKFKRSISYEILYNSFILIAFMQFGVTVFYYLYINHLYKIKQLKVCFEKISGHFLTCWNKYRYKERKIHTLDTIPLEAFEQLQEELLTIDPTQ